MTLSASAILKVILLTLELATKLIKKHNEAEHEKRVNEIKADPRRAFINKFSRMRHTDKDELPSSSPHSEPDGSQQRDNNE